MRERAVAIVGVVVGGVVVAFAAAAADVGAGAGAAVGAGAAAAAAGAVGRSRALLSAQVNNKTFQQWFIYDYVLGMAGASDVVSGFLCVPCVCGFALQPVAHTAASGLCCV